MGDGSFHRRLSPRESKDLIKAALRKGITSFDSAFSYKEADSMLASALRESNTERESVEIISKIMPVPTLKKKAESSLRRLNTTYFDILLLHWPADGENTYESLKKLEELQTSGICREIGVSNFPYHMLKKASEDFPISYHERPLSLIWNKDWENEQTLNLKTLAYAPLGMGLLSMKYRSRDDLSDSRKELFVWHSDNFKNLCTYISSLQYKAADIAYSWVENESPYGIIQGATAADELMIGGIKLSNEELRILTAFADSISSEAPSDNIFSHEYATINA